MGHLKLKLLIFFFCLLNHFYASLPELEHGLVQLGWAFNVMFLKGVEILHQLLITWLHFSELTMDSFLLWFEHPENNLLFLSEILNFKAIVFANLAEFIRKFLVLRVLSLQIFY